MRSALRLLCLSLLLAVPAQAATYALDITTNVREEEILEKRYRRTCLDRINNVPPQAELNNCTPDCATCTPNANNKKNMMEGWVNNRINSDKTGVNQKKADQTKSFYFSATPEEQAAMDAITGVGDQDL